MPFLNEEALGTGGAVVQALFGGRSDIKTEGHAKASEKYSPGRTGCREWSPSICIAGQILVRCP